jgi:hypothetical protein
VLLSKACQERRAMREAAYTLLLQLLDVVAHRLGRVRERVYRGYRAGAGD